MRISDLSSDVCSSDLPHKSCRTAKGKLVVPLPAGRCAIYAMNSEFTLLSGCVRACAHESDHLAQPRVRHLAQDAGDSRGDAGRRVEIGSASCRERGCPYVSISVVVVACKQKEITTP